MSIHQSWFEERQSAWLYRAVAAAEPDARRSALFGKLAEAAERQAAHWEAEAAREGTALPAFAPTARARIVSSLVRGLGPRRLLPALAAMKVRGLSVYTRGQAVGHAMPTSLNDVETRHRGMGGGGNLRAAVFGVNDGLVSNASLIMGVAGAGAASGSVLMTGAAGLLAGALSMAAGEFVSMRSQREMFEYQIGLERDEHEQYPDEEAEELALVYEARGMPLEEARAMTRKLVQDREAALAALAREELGLNPDDLGSPWGAAIFSFLAFTGGAIVPLLPFLLGATGGRAVALAAAAAGAGLFGVGAVLSLFSGRSALAGGLRMLAIGGGAGLVAWGIGHLLGASVG